MTDTDNRIAIPVIIGAVGTGMLLWHVARRQAAGDEPQPAPAPQPSRKAAKVPTGPGWQWPVPNYGDYSPIVTDGLGSKRKTLQGKPRTHEGVDIMYPRRSLDDQATAFPDGTSGGSKWAWMPTGVPALAAADGTVVHARSAPRGHEVQIRHAGNWSTFYAHLTDLRVRKGDKVKMGDALGEIGGDPTKSPKLRHLHFEVWPGKKAENGVIDPKVALRTWQRVRFLTLPDGTSYAQALPPPKHLA